jgi:hypothetical protein
MSTALQFRRGNTLIASTTTGAQGELFVNTDLNSLAVHDGTLAGGHPLMPSSSAQGIYYTPATGGAANILSVVGTVTSTLVSVTNSGVPGLVLGTSTPTTSSATGTAGSIAWDSNYIYVCVATNTWKRVAISTW